MTGHCRRQITALAGHKTRAVQQFDPRHRIARGTPLQRITTPFGRFA